MVKYKVNLIFKDTSKSLNEIITEVLRIELQKKTRVYILEKKYYPIYQNLKKQQ